MQTFRVISDVLGYDYIVEFGEHTVGCYGEPIYTKGVEVSEVITKFKEILDNIPDLTYVENENSFKIKYVPRCNKRIIDTIVKCCGVKCGYYENIEIPCREYQKIKLSSYKISRPVIIVQSNNKPLLITKVSKLTPISIITPVGQLSISSEEFYELVNDKIECVKIDDSNYWSMSEKCNTKNVEKLDFTKNDSDNIKMLLSKVDNVNIELLKLKSKGSDEFKQLEEMDLSLILSDEFKLKGFSETVNTIINFIKRVYSYITENSDELKNVVTKLQEAVDELKVMYAKLEESQNEIIEKGMKPADRKKLAEERKKKEEETKKKLAETEATINEIKNLSLATGFNLADDPDMKNVLGMFNLLKKETEKEEAENKEVEKKEETA